MVLKTTVTIAFAVDVLSGCPDLLAPSGVLSRLIGFASDLIDQRRHLLDAFQLQ